MPLLKEKKRLRSVSAASTTLSGDEDVKALVEVLSDFEFSSWETLERSVSNSDCLQQLRFILKEDGQDDNPQDSFRRVQGFQTVLSALESLSKLCASAVQAGKIKDVMHLFAQLLATLEAALESHAGNNRYFRQRVSERGGWNFLIEVVTEILECLHVESVPNIHTSQVFGLLFATVVGNDAVSDLYTSIMRLDHTDKTAIQKKVDQAITAVYTLAIPDMLTVMVMIWTRYLSIQSQLTPLRLALPMSIMTTLQKSRRSIVSANAADLFSAVGPLLFDDKLPIMERTLFQDIALLLSMDGISRLEDARDLFSRAATDIVAAKFLLSALSVSRQPPSIQFDLTRHGSSSAELANLRKPFPSPDASSSGYSLALWVRFEHFDESAHTTLFGAFDKTHTCFILAYLEKDSKHLILQTAIRGSRPSIRFKSVQFQTGKWYHLCITHKKPKVTTSSKASLFVDGEFMEQIKATFPAYAPIERASGTIQVQAFFGTPQDLSPDTGHRACLSQWMLASAMLYDDVLSDDLVAVMYQLSPRYYGNLQDCLGSFQTYRGSAALNLRNESLNPGKEEHSDLITAIRHKASDLVEEDKILLNISPAAVFDDDDRNSIDESQLIKSLSKVAAKNLSIYTRSGANAIAMNGAVPAINDALVQTNGIAILMGEPTVIVPQSLDDVSFRLGGCSSVGLSLVAKARTTEEVATAVDILFATVRDNWRNSEVMERDNGYSILCNLVREKLSSQSEANRGFTAIATPKMDRNALAVRLLRSTLSFVGYNHDEEDKSIITNALAYRILLIDASLWRTYSPETQELFFKQLTVFAVTSLYSRFNNKRLTRMRVLRRLIEALKGEPVPRQIMPFYSAALKALLPQAMSTEMLRSVALFITFSVHKRNTSRQRKPMQSDVRSRASSTGSTTGPSARSSDNTVLTQFEVGLEVLRLYSDMLCTKNDTAMIKKFATTVTNRWLLYLLSESSPEVVVLATRILARLVVVHGNAYVKKFRDRSGGFAIMSHRLKRWWHLPALWPVCFAIFFGIDVANLDLDRPFELFGFVDLFTSQKQSRITYPEIFEVIMSMLQSGLRTIASCQTPPRPENLVPSEASDAHSPQRLSMSTMAPPNPDLTLVTTQHINTFNTIIRFLTDLQGRSTSFREFSSTSSYMQALLGVLFPVVVGSDIVEATVELNARDSILSFDGMDMIVHPLTQSSPFVRASAGKPVVPAGPRKNLRRGSSFVLVSKQSQQSSLNPEESRSSLQDMSSQNPMELKNENNAVVQAILELVILSFIEQILANKEFTGLGLFLKTPPGFVEHQHYFESWILRNTVSHLSNTVALNQSVMCEPRVLTNLARFFSHLGEAIFEGWFIDGAEPVLDLAGSVLEYLQRPDIARLKSIRLCAQPISIIRSIVYRVVVLSLSQHDGSRSMEFLTKLAYWQNVLLSSEDTESSYLPHVCYLLYNSLVSSDPQIRQVAANLWRIVLMQKPEDATRILNQANTIEQRALTSSFGKLIELDNDMFLTWIDEHREELDVLFHETLSTQWDGFVLEENRKTEDAARSRISRRREKLKGLAKEESEREELIRRHEVTFDHWTANIYASENLKHYRLMQDQQDDRFFATNSFHRMQRELSRSTGLFADDRQPKWRLDQTEGRNRMRMRLVEDFEGDKATQPKRKGTDTPILKLDTKSLRAANSDTALVVSAIDPPSAVSPRPTDEGGEPFPDVDEEADGEDVADAEESFELIDDPNADQGEFEDKNRKVMRSLHRGDQVKHVANISRIVGLEAVEGLLILGKDFVYLIDNFFQRTDGEIVNVWQAPHNERDPYVGMIAGRDIAARQARSRIEDHEARSWKWSEIISISKRRFLFRDVAIEIFFGDGRSYLLTMISMSTRNDLYTRINNKAPQYGNPDSPQSEFAWRYETLKSPEEEPQSLSARFTNVFAQSPVLTATRKWQKGEMSNFHYLMLINTMAGRTYNDLTQYPVFPWVIADYTSETLDLANPKTFRDLSKPMGCQTADREAIFRDRYKSFAEMGDHNAPAFHYGTHYSSAMIVCSYLIRLEPFVKSYLLLQGGNFDHPDRMFFSIEQAWRSASAVNMTDVRELTPEFFYLPEFLTNPNGYDFGLRQNSTKSISDVELPPWAKGDPSIFIAKQREALESPYVSMNLHKWIDLIFGCKQKGEAAIEAVNVFHHLSYQGAKDLDAITDSVERLATIGIIHNFGQTPFQVFQRPHPIRENTQHRYKRLDTAAESLTRLPSTLLDSEEMVASLTYSARTDKLLCSGAFRLNIPPNYDRYMEWGFFDGSIRFYSAETRKQIGLFEHLHTGQLSCALFADSKTLVTSGVDCTIAIWKVVNSGKMIDLQPRATLFGHHRPVTTLAMSRSMNALLSASSTGELMLWDLNRCEYVRRIKPQHPIEISCAAMNDVTGNIVLCHESCVSIYSINGDHLLTQDTSDHGTKDDRILSISCYEGAGNEWLERDILFTGHKKGIVRVWNKIVNARAGEVGQLPFELELIRQLNHVDPAREDGGNVGAGISCILTMPQVVYTGDEDGRVCEWNCVQRH